MPRLNYLDSAKADLQQIHVHLARASGSGAVAAGFVRQLHQHCVKLADLPGTQGRARPELRAELRSLPHKGYVILFRYHAGTFEVINIIEGHRDIDALFTEA